MGQRQPGTKLLDPHEREVATSRIKKDRSSEEQKRKICNN